AINAVRAFDALLYRQEKVRITEEFVRLNEEAARQARALFEQGKLRPADLSLARAEVVDVLSQVGLGRTAVAAARRDWYSVLGLAGGDVEPQGSLQRHAPLIEPDAMLEAALIQRPDLRARQAAAAEAEARLRLARAERFGPVTVGPVYEINETQANFVG